ncbi:putative CDP-diacylglycerol--glycerol-3-phosphate 3-phosphatidyltransferase [Diplonema papillatum]|nr:putative CDP-diacylglycerol--glycerol-3-phosphate 3-phosphatidyltransferase [Diplonema papillatum]
MFQGPSSLSEFVAWAAIAAVSGALVVFRRKVWVLWCSAVLIWRGLRGHVGPFVGKGAKAQARQPCQVAADTLPGSLHRVAEAVSSQAPCFGVCARNVVILKEPAEFLDSLTCKLQTATKRVVMAALYLGVTDRCKQLVNALDKAMATNEHLTCTVLMDYARGQRSENGVSVMTLLEPLVQKYAHGDEPRMQVAMFMVPLCGAVFRHAPPLIREAAGVQHMKAFVIDDDVLITGANLNEDYFTNRKDRYIWFNSSPNIASWVAELVTTMAKCSYHLVPVGNSVVPTYPDTQPHPIYSTPSPIPFHEFSETLGKRIVQLLDRPNDIPAGSDTFVYPSVQLSAIGVDHDRSVTVSAVASSPLDSPLTISSAYPNFTPEIAQAVQRATARDVQLVAPAEDANGFFGAGGLKSLVPPSYTFFLSRVSDAIARPVGVHLWSRRGWTYHGKGVWFTGGTVVGSSNFGARSYSLDTELNFVVLTASPQLSAAFDDELADILANTRPSDVQRMHTSQPWRVKAALSVVACLLHPFL